MCGVFCSTLEVDEDRLRSWMLERGRDGFRFVSEADGVNIYHSLMSISSDLNHFQPFDANGVVISFNGEIYNYPDLAKLLGPQSKKEEQRKETDVVCEFISRFGLKVFAESAVGMFAVVLYDRRNKTIEFCRDYFGQKPLYYSNENNALVVGSQYSYFPSAYAPELDRTTITQMINFGFPIGDRTPLKGVFSCPRGTVAKYCMKGRRLTFQNFQPKDRDFGRLTYRDTFSYLPLVAYSGGIDSVYVAHKLSNVEGLKLASLALAESVSEITTRYSSFEEAEQFLWKFHGHDFENALLQLSEAKIDPVLDPGAAVFQHLMAHCSDHTRVVFGGDGGDELFYGYGRMKVICRLEQRLAAIPDIILGRVLFFVYLFAISRRPLTSLMSCWSRIRKRHGETWAQTFELDHFFQTVLRKSDSIALINNIEYRCPILEEFLPCDGDPNAKKYKGAINLTGKAQKVGFAEIPEGWISGSSIKNKIFRSRPSNVKNWRLKVIDDWKSKIFE